MTDPNKAECGLTHVILVDGVLYVPAKVLAQQCIQIVRDNGPIYDEERAAAKRRSGNAMDDEDLGASAARKSIIEDIQKEFGLT